MCRQLGRSRCSRRILPQAACLVDLPIANATCHTACLLLRLPLLQALIWDMGMLAAAGQAAAADGLGGAPGAALDPILAYDAGAEINQLQWSSSQPDWVAICFGNKAQILRV